jgi:hypothetical protein
MAESERDREEAGAREGSASESPAGTQHSPVERAEVIVDRLGARLGEVAAVAGHELRRVAARAREETEDIWAEAKDVRARWRGDSDERRPDVS